MPLDLEQFKKIIPLLGEEFIKAKNKEIKFRLREMK